MGAWQEEEEFRNEHFNYGLGVYTNGLIYTMQWQRWLVQVNKLMKNMSN